MLRVVTAPALEPLSLDEAKEHCQVDLTSTYYDNYLTDQIKVAREDAEAYLGRALITRTYQKTLEAWPTDGEIRLPMSPVQTDSFKIEYYNSANVLTEWSSANYELDNLTIPARVRPVTGVSFPTTAGRYWPILITYKAGYGVAGDDVPEKIRQALRFRIGTNFTLRESVVIGTILSEYKEAFEKQLHPFRVYPMKVPK